MTEDIEVSQLVGMGKPNSKGRPASIKVKGYVCLCHGYDQVYDRLMKE